MEKSMSDITVIKRDGQVTQLDLEKIHKMVELACRGLAGVSESAVEMNANLQIFDGIKTEDIQEILIKSANDLISLDAPNYQFVAARLLLFGLRKAVYNGHPDGHPTVLEQLEKGVELGVYDKPLINAYSREEWEEINSFVEHDRDYLFTYAGLRQVTDKYLVQDRSAGKIFETPQFMYVLIAATLFQQYPQETRLEYIRRYYDAISQHKINIPTPIMGGVRTPLRQFASCVLVDVDDTLDSIFPIWHQEIEDIIVLKNNKGTEDNRVRKLDYSVQISKLFYERFIRNENISLFSPHDVPGLYDAFGTDEFDQLYARYEADDRCPRRTIPAQELILALLKERAETGRLYIMNIDHCNSHSSFKDKVNMSNLCQEITLPTDPISHIDDEGGEIALCILSAINVGKLRTLNELENLCDLAVRGLEELIDYQGYPVKAAERSTLARRSLGIGYIGLAHYLAKHGEHYDDPTAWRLVHELTEAFQYNLLKASNALAKERGPCDAYQHTKYHDGILPIDTYKRDLDEIVAPEYKYDWDSLRTDIQQYGLRHSTLSAQMPSESSSVVSNATNGIEPPRDYLSIKKSKKGPLKQIVPSYTSLKNNYTLLWDLKSNAGYINIVAVMQKFFDQAISGNWSYNPENYDNNEVPVSVMAQDLLMTYKLGWKTSYYQNTYDAKKDPDESPSSTEVLDSLINDLMNANEEECDACNV